MPDLHERLAALRERAPAAWVRSFGRPTVMFTSYELVNAAFKDEETFPSAAFYGNVVRTCWAGTSSACTATSTAATVRWRRPPSVSASCPDSSRPLLEPVAHELIDRFEARGEADLVAEFTKRYPFKIILRLLGLPQASEEEVTRGRSACSTSSRTTTTPCAAPRSSPPSSTRSCSNGAPNRPTT